VFSNDGHYRETHARCIFASIDIYSVSSGEPGLFPFSGPAVSNTGCSFV
jgi:hypothetical protein